MHPENSLIALLLPGAVFCCLGMIEWWQTGAKPQLRLLGWQFPTPLVYVVILCCGWLVLGLWVFQRFQGKKS